MFPTDTHGLASQIIALYTEQKRRIVTAESCTGGMVAAVLTDIAGSSAVFERGFVTYSLDAKIDLLGVLPELLEKHGAVSAEVAEAMAEGALAYSLADVAISVTGIAGPSGAEPGKPVGLVYFGLASRGGGVLHYSCSFHGDRAAIRSAATNEALRLILLTAQKD